MSDDFIIEQCAPTLAGIKTGNLFSCAYSSREELLSYVRELNRRLVPKGLCLLPMRYSEKRVLLYLYRPTQLKRDLQNEYAAQMLRDAGYSCASCEQCVVRLIRRLRENTEFPHEIGLFLGYPPEDVRGFIENKADNFKCVGTWKVYGDAEKAQKTFTLYRKCESVYRRQWSHGKTIEQLTVAV